MISYLASGHKDLPAVDNESLIIFSNFCHMLPLSFCIGGRQVE